jgi:hypothetical protein
MVRMLKRVLEVPDLVPLLQQVLRTKRSRSMHLANVTYGDAPFALTATASSGLTVTYQSSNTNVATVSGNTVTIVGAGSTNITASQAGDINWNPAPDVIQSLTVDPKELTVTGAVAQTKTYDGNANAAIDLTGATLNGVVSPDNVTFSGAGTFAQSNAGTGIAVTANLTWVVLRQEIISLLNHQV